MRQKRAGTGAKFFRSRFFIICVCIALALVLIPSMLSVFGYTGIVRGALKTVATPFEWCGTKLADAVRGFTSVFTNYDDLKEENESLREAVESLENEKNDNSVIREENRWLKEYLDIKTENPALELTDATVIARESGAYSTVITLNRGLLHGVKKKMPVITEDGIFGYVSECGPSSCKVVSIIETASSVGAYIDRSGVTGVIEGDNSMRLDGTCRLTYIDAGADIKVGDRVYTSGAGSIYPEGLLVGTVTEIKADDATRTLSATVTPAVDFGNINEIVHMMVVVGYVDKSGGNDK